MKKSYEDSERAEVPIRVVHILGSPLMSGAGRGALNLHNALCELGVDSRILLTVRKHGSVSDKITVFSEHGIMHFYSSGMRYLDRLISWARRGKGSTFTAGIIGANPFKHDWVKNADIVNIHWIRGSPSIQAIGRRKKPTIITIRDMWSFTGGCHYSGECARYAVGCGYCPLLNSKRLSDRSRWLHALKKRVWSKNPYIYPVGISPWVSQETNRSGVFGETLCLTIWNGIDRSQFLPINIRDAISELGLDPRNKYVSLGAIELSSFYKGGRVIESILNNMRELFKENVRLLVFGNKTSHISQIIPNSIDLGFITDDRKMNLIYSASTVFIAPSLQEAFGKTIAEALSSGTPVIAFNTSGPANIIKHFKTGYLAEPYSISSFVEGVFWALSLSEVERSIIENNCIIRSEDFCQKKNAKKYIDLYKEVLGIV